MSEKKLIRILFWMNCLWHEVRYGHPPMWLLDLRIGIFKLAKAFHLISDDQMNKQLAYAAAICGEYAAINHERAEWFQKISNHKRLRREMGIGRF